MDGETPTPKKERPQNKNLKPLGSGLLTPEEEKAIRDKGREAQRKARHENAELRWRIRKLLTMGYTRGKIADIEDIDGLQKAQARNIPVIDKIIINEIIRCLEQGDKESRDWLISRYGDAIDPLGGAGLTITASDTDGNATNAPGVRIQLVRGAKPHDPNAPTPPKPIVPEIPDTGESYSSTMAATRAEGDGAGAANGPEVNKGD